MASAAPTKKRKSAGGQVSKQSRRKTCRTLHEVATAFDVSISTVSNWIRQGAPGKEDGVYTLSKISDWRASNTLLAPTNTRAKHRANGEAPVGTEREKLLKAQRQEREAKAELADIQVKIARGEYLPVADIKQRDVEKVAIVKRGLLSLPRRLSHELQGLGIKEMESILTARFRELLTRFSEM